MNIQIGFVMTDEEEQEFIDFLRQNRCTILKRAVFEGESPFAIYPCDNIYSKYYFIADMYTDNDTLYTETILDGKIVKQVQPYDNSMTSKPLIEFVRGRIDDDIGRIYAYTDNMTAKNKRHIISRLKLIREWMRKNSTMEIDVEKGWKIYFLPQAAEQYKNNNRRFILK